MLQKGEGFQFCVTDIRMPGMDGLDGIDRIRQSCLNVPVVILSGTYDRDLVLDALARGARGYIPKTLGGKAMLSAFQLVLSGETFVPSIVLGGNEQFEPVRRGAGGGSSDNPIHRLTRRERDVLAVLVEGHPNKEIARQLGLQEVTVKVHLKGVFRKLGATNRTQAVHIANQLGWTS